uniref:AlNc14C833G12557 protein n=1 Tax=Albugo laibachii Nc14 TaxID=890382 RepID=F0X248_9STRA|nr:AlNc14C833G12557 [Albugo laibachii Nc14]|eukprot:CCA27920.1 AlNc14C833G12557 [Albugo laibachii Nc14]
MEVEFTSASHARQELLGLRELLTELKFEMMLPMTMEMNNQSTIQQLKTKESSSETKRIDIKLKLVKYCARNGILKATFVPTEEMEADLLTKAFSAARLQN